MKKQLNPRSLRFQLCLWHMFLVMITIAALGAFSLNYLSRALASSRETTLRHRFSRIVHFANGMPQQSPSRSVGDIFQEFRLVSAESDLFIVQDIQGVTIFPAGDGRVIAWPHDECPQVCVSIQMLDGKRMRLVQQTALVRGQKLRITLAGQVDEHSDIVQVVRNSYLISLPILLAISLCGGLLLAHRALAPVDRITRSAQTISIHDLQRRLPVPDTGDEIERLTVACNELLERLETAVNRLKQFTSDISHDLKTSLTVMSATAQVALRRERTPQEHANAFRTILMECKSTKELLDDLLATSHSDPDEQRVHHAISLSEIVEESCEQIRGAVEVKHLSFEAEIADEQWVNGDVSMIRRLVMILLDNAVKYTPESGHIRVSLQSSSAFVQLRVEDTGIGIAQQHMEKIFDRSYRADTSRNRNGGGNGLGLAIARWIADSHQVTLIASSHLGNGSVFSVDFPARPVTGAVELM